MGDGQRGESADGPVSTSARALTRPCHRRRDDDKVRDYRRALEAKGVPCRRLGVEWNAVTVTGQGADTAFHDDVLSQFNIVSAIKTARKPAPTKTILDESFGLVKPGEMMLVLARPGGGSTTLLRVLSNQRTGYSSVQGDVMYGSMDHKEAAQFRGQIVMNGEEVSMDRGRIVWRPCRFT
jgi:ATP-binding cassette subfamily G (WHITE) protein 2 (SNQ2)